jgi:hypothetical protein
MPSGGEVGTVGVGSGVVTVDVTVCTGWLGTADVTGCTALSTVDTAARTAVVASATV